MASSFNVCNNLQHLEEETTSVIRYVLVEIHKQNFFSDTSKSYIDLPIRLIQHQFPRQHF